jgi:hypothetical protein
MAGKTCRITVTDMNGMAHSISDYGRDFVRSCFLGDLLPSRPQRALNGPCRNRFRSKRACGNYLLHKLQKRRFDVFESLGFTTFTANAMKVWFTPTVSNCSNGHD